MGDNMIDKKIEKKIKSLYLKGTKAKNIVNNLGVPMKDVICVIKKNKLKGELLLIKVSKHITEKIEDMVDVL